MRDVIVVGAGGGGPVVAKELAARGLDVLLLEAGSRYGSPRTEWTHFENDANSPIDGFFRFGPRDRSQPPWFQELPQNSFLWQVSGVGGTTLHYYGNSPRAMRGVFQGYDGPDAGAYDQRRFPFSYEELVPYYEWVEETLPVQTAAMGTKEERYFVGAEGIGLPVQTTKTTIEDSFRPQENAILQPGGTAGRTRDRDRLRFPEARGCVLCGHCFQGCMLPLEAPRNQFAKRSTDNSYVPMALTADAWAPEGRPITLVADAYVTQVHTEVREGEVTATGVTWRDTASGDEQREDARVVVLAGGCTETPRLWFNSDLPNPNDWVGRGYTDHFFDWVIGVFDDDVGNTRGAASAARCDFPGRGGLENVGLTPALQAFAMTLSDSGIRDQYTNGRGMTGPWDGPAGRLIGPELKDALANNADRLMNILVITDDDVEAQNRVVPSAFPGDAHGPVARVSFPRRERSARTVANREFLVERAVALLRAAGARAVYRIDWAPLFLHVQSSMRMGESESDSVLDGDAQSRWVRGLYVADNSALANALGGPNPTLTTQALATRTSERIFQEHFGGDPWVGQEDPVVSTDSRVTDSLASVPT